MKAAIFVFFAILLSTQNVDAQTSIVCVFDGRLEAMEVERDSQSGLIPAANCYENTEVACYTPVDCYVRDGEIVWSESDTVIVLADDGNYAGLNIDGELQLVPLEDVLSEKEIAELLKNR